MVPQKRDDLALYYYDYCPYCVRVLRALKRLGISVRMRHIHEQPEHRAELVAARGHATVPVLRIAQEGREDIWMPESQDIVRYLEEVVASSTQ